MKARMTMGFFTAIALAAAGAAGGGALKSGPQVGKDIPGAFHPLNITGASAGEKNCLV